MPSAWIYNTNWADSGVFSLISSFTPALVNDFRYSMTYWSNNNAPPTAAECPGCLDLGGPNITVEGTGLELGNQTNSPQSRVLRRDIFADNMTGRKAATARSSAANGSTRRARARIPLLPKTYTTLNDVLKLPLESFDFSYGNNSQPPPFQEQNADHDNTIHVYWQDTLKWKPNFTVNYGLAWTYETNALNHDLSKPSWLEPLLGADGLKPENHAPLHFSPALGFAWSPGKDNKTVVRGGVGIYYDTIDIELRLIERNYIGPLGSGYLNLPGSIVPNPIPGVPGVKPGQPLDFTSTGPTAFTGAYIYAILPQVISTVEREVPPNPANKDLSVTTIGLFKTETELIDRNFVPPSAQHASIGVQRQVTNDFGITADLVYRHFIHLTQRDEASIITTSS